MLRRLQEPFEVKLGKLKRGSQDVVHSHSRKLNISWFCKPVEIAIHCWAYILKLYKGESFKLLHRYF